MVFPYSKLLEQVPRRGKRSGGEGLARAKAHPLTQQHGQGLVLTQHPGAEVEREPIEQNNGRAEQSPSAFHLRSQQPKSLFKDEWAAYSSCLKLLSFNLRTA